MKKNKKILFINARLLDQQNAGIFRLTNDLLKALHDKDALPFEIVLMRDKKDDIFSKFKTVITPLQWLPFSDVLTRFIFIPYYTKKNKASVAFEPAHIGPFNLPSKIKRITFIHDLTPVLFKEFHKPLSAFLQKLLLPRIIKNAHLVIANSKNTKKDIVNLYAKSQNEVQLIYPGINKVFLSNNQLNVEIIKPEKPYLLSTATLEPRKNLSLLISAFEQIKAEQNTELQLILVGGDGWKNKKLLTKISNSPFKNDIKLEGFVNDQKLKSLYRNCTAFIYPSHYEGFGLPVVEAAAMGAFTIVANNSSLVEVSPYPSLLFNSNDVSSLCKKIKSVLNNDVHELSFDVKEKYKWSQSVDTFISIINSVMYE